MTLILKNLCYTIVSRATQEQILKLIPCLIWIIYKLSKASPSPHGWGMWMCLKSLMCTKYNHLQIRCGNICTDDATPIFNFSFCYLVQDCHCNKAVLSI